MCCVIHPCHFVFDSTAPKPSVVPRSTPAPKPQLPSVQSASPSSSVGGPQTAKKPLVPPTKKPILPPVRK